jgi:hypothetical protein
MRNSAGKLPTRGMCSSTSGITSASTLTSTADDNINTRGVGGTVTERRVSPVPIRDPGWRGLV